MATKVINTTFKFRRGLSAIFAQKNIVLAAGEPGFELDTKKLKVGDGTTAWNDLEYLTGNTVDYTTVSTQINQAVQDGDIILPVATNENSGVVISSNNKNKITVNSDGTMTINDIGIEKLSNTDGVQIIFYGGTA